jgi:hypothetical protein
MRRSFARFVSPLRLPFVLAVFVIAAMTSLPADSGAAPYCPTMCEYDYYYDSARTQWAGYCQGACYPGGAYCYGVITDYYRRYGCEPCGCWGEQQ